MKDNITFKSKRPLHPLKVVTPRDLPRIRIGRSFTDLARLGMVGEYEMVEATPMCPRLYYRFNYFNKEWEIYAVDKDLIGYNLLSSGELKIRTGKLEGRVDNIEDIIDDIIPPTPIPPTPDPDPDPEPEPDPDPEPEPEPLHSRISRDPDFIGGDDLITIIDGGIMILGGKIKWYDADRRFKVAGNYVGCMITPPAEFLEEFGESLKIEYRGMVYDKSILVNGRLILDVSIRCPGQEVPINFFWTKEFAEHFVVAITQESELEIKE